MTYAKIMIFALLSVLAMGLSACNGGTATQGTIYTGGTNALLFSFEDGAPPDLIYDNAQTPFPIMLRVRNDGEFDTRNIRWRITGINVNDFQNLDTNGLHGPIIMGRTKLQDQVIEGSEDYIMLGSNVCYHRSLAGGGELRDLSITAHMCYAYATLATATVCIRENYLDGGDGCDPRESSSISVSGGPITVTGFSQQAVGTNRLRLQFDVALRNNVRVWAPYKDQTCSEGKDRSSRLAEQNQVYARIDTRGIGDVSCVTLRDAPSRPSGAHPFDGPYVLENYPQDLLTAEAIRVMGLDLSDDGYFSLGSENRASIICTLELEGGLTDSLGTIDLALTYYLEDSVTAPLTITHTGGPAGTC